MATLKFIGLANYKPVSNNLVNIIFTSNQSAITTYQYIINPVPLTVNPLANTWINIPLLTNVKIPAFMEISAQLDTGATSEIYTIYIRACYLNVTSDNIIWQTSTPFIPPNIPITTTSIGNYSDIIQYTTTIGGEFNINFTPNGVVNASITSNIIYTNATNQTTINITSNYNDTFPVFIMSNSTIKITSALNSTSGSINIVGTGTSNQVNVPGILITTGSAITITSKVAFNGTALGSNGIAVYIEAEIKCSGYGYVTLNGRGSGFGVNIAKTITNLNAGNVIINGLGSIPASIGINIGVSITNQGSGDIILNGTGGTSGNGINIPSSTPINISNTSTGNVIFNGTTEISNGIYIGGGLTISNTTTGTIRLNGIATSGNGIYIIAYIKCNVGNVTLNGTASFGKGVYIDQPITITGNVFFNITILANNFILPYISKNSNYTLTGIIKIIIDPSSVLEINKTYYILADIPVTNIGTTSGTFGNIGWNIISNPSNSNYWYLVTIVNIVVPSAPTNIIITKLSVNSYFVKWSTLLVDDITTTSFYFNGKLGAIIPVTLGTIVDVNINYKVQISGCNQAPFITAVINDLLIGNNTLQLRTTNNIGGISLDSLPIIFSYNNISNPIYVDYNIISSYTLDDLKKQVKNLMSIGWEPIGGIVPHNNPSYIQTMVLIEQFNIIHEII